MGSFLKIISALAVFYVTLVAAGVVEETSTSEGQKRRMVSNECIWCICLAKTGCKNENGKCLDDNSQACGRLGITKGYYIDGGSITVPGVSSKDEGAFESCAKDYQCSAETMYNYMQRYKKDCNGDGVIDCKDFAAIHEAGAGACSGKTGQDFAEKVNKCLMKEGGCKGNYESSPKSPSESETVAKTTSKHESSTKSETSDVKIEITESDDSDSKSE